MSDEYIPVFFGMVLVFIGFMVFNNAKKKIRKSAYANQNWSMTTATIVKSGYKISNTASTRNRGRHGNTYKLDMEYEYQVGGKQYRSTQPLFFNLYLLSDIESFIETYPKDHRTTIYYDPNKPDDAVLETTLRGKSGRHEKAMGIIVLMAGIIVIVANLLQ